MIQENQRLVRLRDNDSSLTCIVCPIGCQLEVEHAPDGSITIIGNRCKRGEAYAHEEFEDPRRVVTATCAIEDGETGRLPVRSTQGVPVASIAPFLASLYKLRPHAPISPGDVLATNVASTGIDLIATMSVNVRRASSEEGEQGG